MSVAREVPRGVRIRTLGTFAVHTGAGALELPNGLPRQALKLAIVHGGQVHVEVVMECLWPGIDPSGGRKGVRNILSRLATSGVPTLIRDDEVLRLADHVRVDATRFRMLTDRALTAPTPDLGCRFAREALALYQGTFLPGDRYVDWTEPIRRRLLDRRLAMLDLLANHAREHGADLQAVHLMELALEDDPFDEVRYFELAETLLAMGRRGRAAALIDRADVVLQGLGLPPDPSWNRLRHDLGRVRTPASRFESRHRPTATPAVRSDASPGSPGTPPSPTSSAHHYRPPEPGPNHRGAFS